MKQLFILPLAALTLLACTRQTVPTPEAQRGPEVRFTASIQNELVLKSASTTALNGKTVRIVADASLGNATTTATAQDGALTVDPENKICWNVGQTDPSTFVGIYGGESVPAAPAGLQVAYNMLDNDTYNYAYHSAYLTAVTDPVNPGETAALHFKHPFSKVIVTIDKQITGELSAPILKNVVLSATLNLAADNVTSPAAAGNVTMVASETANVYEAVIMPVSAQPTIVVPVGGKDYIFAITAPVAFAANKSYSVTITITDNTPASGDALDFSFDVTDWEAYDGDAISYNDITEQWSIIGSVNGDNWSTDIVMPSIRAGVYKVSGINVGVGDKFLVRKSASYDYKYGMKTGVEYIDTATGDNQYLTVDGADIVLSQAGIWDITFADYKLLPERKGDLATGTLNIYVTDQTGWTGENELHVYSYAGVGELLAWPGYESTASGDYKKFTLTGVGKNVTSKLIFNNNNHELQLADYEYVLKADSADLYLTVTTEGVTVTE